MDEYFPDAVEVVDDMHTKSYLYDVAKQAFGEDTTEAVEDWVKSTEVLLYDGNTREVVARIRGLGIGNPELWEA